MLNTCFRILTMFLITASMLKTNRASAQSFNYHYNTYNAALTSNKIYGITIDSSGFLWLATEKGLVRFNGGSFESLSPQDGLPDENLVGIQYINGKLMPLSYYGILYDVEQVTRYPYIKINSYRNFNCVLFYCYEAGDSIFWLGNNQTILKTKDRLYAQKCSRKDIIRYLDREEPGHKIFKDLNWHAYQKVAWETLASLISDTLRTNFERIGKYNTLLLHREIYTAHNKQLYKLLDFSFPGLTKDAIISDIEFYNKDLYIAVYHAEGGIFLIRDFFNTENSPKSPVRISEKGYALAVTKDKLNNIWYSIDNMGLYYINMNFRALEECTSPFKDVHNYKYIKAVDDNNIICIAPNRVTTYNYLYKNTVHYDNSLNALKKINANAPGINHDNTFYFKDNTQNPAYTLYTSKLIKYNSAWEETDIVYLDENNANVQCADIHNNLAILCNKNGHISLYDLESKSYLIQKTTADLSLCEDVYFYSDSLILFCAQTGVYIANKSLDKISKISGKHYKKIARKDSTFYLANNFKLASLSINQQPYKINTLLNTRNILNKFTINDMDLSENYTHILTDKGLVRFLTDSLSGYNADKMHFRLYSVQNNDTLILCPDTASISLKPSFQELVIFNIQFLDPESISYEKSYSLAASSGYDQWIDFTGNSISVLGIRPGTYYLKIKQRFSESDIERTIVYKIIVEAHLWQTIWFKLIVIGLITGAAVIQGRRLIAAQTRKNYEKLQLAKYLEELENKVFLNQLNPHFLYNALNTLQDYLIEKDTHNGIIYLQRVAGLSRNILDFQRVHFITVKEETEFLERYLYIQKTRYDSKFDYSIQFWEAHRQIKIPPMLIQPVCENAIEHGFAGYKTGGSLTISFELFTDYMAVCVSDNGTGKIEDFYPLKHNHALHMIQERLGLIKQAQHLKTEFLTIRQNVPKGISLTINIPVSNYEKDELPDSGR